MATLLMAVALHCNTDQPGSWKLLWTIYCSRL